MRARVLIPLVLAAGLAVGCSGQHDPRTGGFFGGVAGLGGGGYKDRVAEREARLAELRATQSQLDAEKGQLETQKSEAQARVQQDQAKVDAMQADIAALEKKTKALASKQGVDQTRVAELQKRLAGLKAGMNKQESSLDALEGSGLGDADTDLRRKQLEAQRDALRKEYDLLMKMQMELAQ
jgi:chromosome segregation ATPase